MPDRNLVFSPSTRVYLWTAVVLLVFLGLSLTFYFLGSKTQEPAANTNTAANQNTDVMNTGNTPSVTPEPAIITSRTGAITKLSGSAISFQSPVYNDEKRIYENVELTAQYTEATTFLEIDRRTLPVPPMPGQPAQAPASRVIEKGELRIGDAVDVSAATNIRGEKTFTATAVRKILTR